MKKDRAKNLFLSAFDSEFHLEEDQYCFLVASCAILDKNYRIYRLFKNLRSQLVKSLISFIPYLTATRRLIPIPKANPVRPSSGFTPASFSTFGWIIPAPRISIHFDISLFPVLGFTYSYLVSISKPGSTKGKYAGLILISTFFWRATVKKSWIIVLKCAMLIFLSIYTHSNYILKSIDSTRQNSSDWNSVFFDNIVLSRGGMGSKNKIFPSRI